ncbi:GMC oxidoreductase family protein [Mycobacterium xenopi 3993]|nr:GMC oxidoreductase family protein [Mycobacterium xenopi 3993]
MTAAGPRSDVLIIGAGSAGSVVAERLSGDPSCVVTVLEAGTALADPDLLAQTANGLQLPIGAASPLVQRYEAQLTEQPARRMPIVRGATVGGSGAVNGGYFCRGLPRDFDRIEAPGWAWVDVLDHFRAIETDLDFDARHTAVTAQSRSSARTKWLVPHKCSSRQHTERALRGSLI